MAQTFEIKGRVKDAETNEPLAFVNIIFNGGKYGVVSNIDGFYKINDARKYPSLTYSLLGYETKVVALDSLKGSVLDITLKAKTVDLQEVVVMPGVNPALRIIDQVIENRNRNNPEKMLSFSYSSYNKMHFTTQKEKTAAEQHL
ncbi:MAG: carboxypeptidase-like regulatory domain-containing protein [Bacteroidales bacterium]|nr:carboxypeptidase-like regulatory domain-containing protein [Bacteroidales bacterium]